MPRAALQIRKTIVFVHRWMGLIFCLPFLMWFASGVVMMYWDYPMVTAADRLIRMQALDTGRIRIAPEEAYKKLKLADSDFPDRAYLITFAGRPAYRFVVDGAPSIVYADNGQTIRKFPPELTLQIAAAWTGQPATAAKAELNTAEDQWTVSGEFRACRPMWKYTWPDGEEVYVSTVTGEVVQYTTRASRAGAYFGAIPHWFYFTPLRRHAETWSQFVIYASGLGSIVVLLGIVIGLWMYSPGRRFRYAGKPSRIPYAGTKRWHMVLGLVIGLFAFSWVFSGMLSMDPFPQWQSGDSEETGFRLEGALRGNAVPLSAFADKSPREALTELGSNFPVKEVEFTSFAGEPVYLARIGPAETRVIPVHGPPIAEFDHDKIIELLRKAARPANVTQVRLVSQYESYYLDRRGRLPLPVIFVQLDDDERSMYYVDPRTASILEGYDSRSRRNRWLYHGLHSIDLPWLYTHRPLWDVVVLALLLGGICLCVTSVMLAWRVLRRKQSFKPPSQLA